MNQTLVDRIPSPCGGATARECTHHLLPEVFAEAIRPHVRQMVNTARRLLGSEDLAWDAVQEALISLWQEPSWPPNLRAWLLRTVTNRSRHLLRCRARRRKHEEQAAALRPETGAGANPARLVETCELCNELKAALAQLPLEQRQVFCMHELDEMHYDAIAHTLCVPVGTIRSRLSRARERLRAILGREAPTRGAEESLTQPGTHARRAAFTGGCGKTDRPIPVGAGG
jgi:RNA polymerase sigma-70 factor (ECF subfamily)